MKLNNVFHPLSYNFVHFDDEQFWLCFFPRFEAPIQNFDFCPFKLEFEIAKIQYRSYLPLSTKHWFDPG